MLDLHGIGENRGHRWVEVVAESNIGLRPPGKGQGDCILDDPADRHRLRIDVLFCDEVTHPTNNRSSQQRLFARHFHKRLSPFEICGISEDHVGSPQKIDRRGERLVQLVREASRHFAHRAQAGDMQQLGTHLRETLFGSVALRKVLAKAGEQMGFSTIRFTQPQFDGYRRAISPLHR